MTNSSHQTPLRRVRPLGQSEQATGNAADKDTNSIDLPRVTPHLVPVISYYDPDSITRYLVSSSFLVIST